SKCEGKAASTADEPAGGKSENDGGNITMYVIIGAAFIAVAGVGIYVKVIRPKKQQPEFDDDESDDYGEYDGADDYGEPEYLPDDDIDES
ncbi:MAG: bacteriocin, partial [Ruminococcus sp.]